MISSEKLEVFNPKAETYKKKRYKVYQKLISPYFLEGRLLDIGGGYGTGSNLFKQAGFSVEVIEAENNKINFITNKLGLPVISTYLETFVKHVKNKYDVVIFSNCLEHLDNPMPVIEKMDGLLRPNGIMLLSVPSFWDSINWSDSLYLTHKSNFMVENIIELLTKNGFEILEMIRVPYFMEANYQEMALIIRKNNHKVKFTLSYQNKQIIINEIIKLYHKDLPIKYWPINKTIRYDVPHIDQFFQTLNLENYDIDLRKNFITFMPNDNHQNTI